MLLLVYLSSFKMYTRRYKVTVHFDQESQYSSGGKIFSWVATAHPGKCHTLKFTTKIYISNEYFSNYSIFVPELQLYSLSIGIIMLNWLNA